MIDILHDIFVAVLYLSGIGFFGFIATALWAAVIRFLREYWND